MPTKLRFFVQGPTENPFGAPPPPPPAGPTISTQPTAQSVTVPATATFSVVATGTGALSYQWQVNTGGGTFVDVTGANGSGGTTASFTTVASIIGMNGYSYRVEVTDSNGTTVSNAVGLTVTAGAPTSTYLDGTYTAEKDYPVPHGHTEVISISLTLTNDIISNLQVTTTSSNGESEEYQGPFDAAIVGAVEGQDLDAADVSNLTGASLTSNAFNDLIAVVKTDATP